MITPASSAVIQFIKNPISCWRLTTLFLFPKVDALLKAICKLYVGSVTGKKAARFYNTNEKDYELNKTKTLPSEPPEGRAFYMQISTEKTVSSIAAQTCQPSRSQSSFTTYSPSPEPPAVRASIR